MRKTILSVAALLLLVGNAYATTIGYSKDAVVRNMFRLGSTTTQGQAIKLSKEKLQALKGKTIDYVEFAVGSKQTKNNVAHVFISTSLGGTPLAEGDAAISKAYAKNKWQLSKPYTITGDEDALYIGYTAEIGTSYSMLLADGTFDISGCNFAYNDGEWVDTYGMNRGSAYITFNVDGAPDYTDVIMGASSYSGYYKAGGSYDFSARFLNAGTMPITSFDAVVTVDGVSSSQHFDGVNIAPRTNYSFKLSDVNSQEEGSKDLSVEIKNVNGSSSAEYDPTDNRTGGTLFFYPSNMERSVLVEGFTSQQCTNCPSGHVVMNSAIATARDNGVSVVEVSHHSGFYPDIFTMAEDADYTFYYNNPSSTYAPAVMVNRNADPSIGIAPVSEVSTYNILQSINHALASNPYASLNLETAWDESTRQLKVKLGIKPHRDFPTDKVLFNLFLVQDGITAYQINGGNDYVHDRVFRGTLTDNSYGIIINNLKAGEETVWEKTVTIPEKIHSSLWTDDMIQEINGKKIYVYDSPTMPARCDIEQSNIEAIAGNMSVVAYVAEYDRADNTKNIIFNCCESKLGESYKQAAYDGTSAIESVAEREADANVYAEDGRIRVAGDYDRLLVYSLSGTMVNPDANLAKGTYIVKVVSGGKQSTKKILVR